MNLKLFAKLRKLQLSFSAGHALDPVSPLIFAGEGIEVLVRGVG